MAEARALKLCTKGDYIKSAKQMTNDPLMGRGFAHVTHFCKLATAMLSAVYADVVCLCVCVSVTLRYCIKTAKRRIMQTTPHDSPVTLVF